MEDEKIKFLDIVIDKTKQGIFEWVHKTDKYTTQYRYTETEAVKNECPTVLTFPYPDKYSIKSVDYDVYIELDYTKLSVLMLVLHVSFFKGVDFSSSFDLTSSYNNKAKNKLYELYEIITNQESTKNYMHISAFIEYMEKRGNNL